MPTIGETLREARMRQRLDIADVEERTKIRAKYLRALENEEFALLPGPTFVKTFLRTYAEVLGLDPHVLVEDYRANHEPGREDLEAQPLGAPSGGAPPPPRERRYPGGPPSRGAVIGILVGGLLVFLLVLGLTGNDEDGSEEAAQTTTTSTERKPARKRKRPRPRFPASVTLQITPAPQGTYICADRGPGTTNIFNSTVTEAPPPFKGKKIRFRLGNRSAEVKLNGKPFPIEPGADPIDYEVSVKGHKELPEFTIPCSGSGTTPSSISPG